MNIPTPFQDFLLQVLEAELSTVGAYDAAVPHAVSEELREKWRNARTTVARHHRRLSAELELLHLESGQSTEGRELVHSYGASLIRTIIVGTAASPDAAEMCAAQSLSDLNARCCLNWEFLDGVVTDHHLGLPGSLLALVPQVLGEKQALCEASTNSLRLMWDKRLGLASVADEAASPSTPQSAPGGGETAPA